MSHPLATLSEFGALFATSKLVHVSSIDFVILSAFAFDPIREDMCRRGWWDPKATDNDLKRLDKFDINFYALRKDGVFAGGSLWSGQMRGTGFVSRKFAVNDGTGNSRLIDCQYLHERRR